LAGLALARYKRGMRRSIRLGFAAAIALVAALGAYCAYWFIAAGRIEEGVGRWADSLRAQNLDLAWRSARVGGFPFRFRLELSAASLRQHTAAPGPELHVPLLTASASPWNFHVFRLAAPQGLSAASGGDHPEATLAARRATGVIVVAATGGATLWFALSEPAADAGVHLAAREATVWLNLPPHPPQSHGDPAVGVALEVRELTLPVVPPPFHNPLDEVSLGLTLRGGYPAGTLRQAAAAWRDAGGTLDLDHLALSWDALRVTGSGTLALDSELQPIGGFSGAVEGYPQLMTALVGAGRMRAGDARLAGLALAMLSRAGPDGRPEIATSFTIQNGEMYLGPAKLGRAPRIDWQ